MNSSVSAGRDASAEVRGRIRARLHAVADIGVVAVGIGRAGESATRGASIGVVGVAVVALLASVDPAVATALVQATGGAAITVRAVAVVALLAAIEHPITAEHADGAVGAALVTVHGIAIIADLTRAEINDAVPTTLVRVTRCAAPVAIDRVAVIADLVRVRPVARRIDDAVSTAVVGEAVAATRVSVIRVAIVAELTGRGVEGRVATGLVAHAVGAATVSVLDVAIVTRLTALQRAVTAAGDGSISELASTVHQGGVPAVGRRRFASASGQDGRKTDEKNYAASRAHDPPPRCCAITVHQPTTAKKGWMNQLQSDVPHQGERRSRLDVALAVERRRRWTVSLPGLR